MNSDQTPTIRSVSFHWAYKSSRLYNVLPAERQLMRCSSPPQRQRGPRGGWPPYRKIPPPPGSCMGRPTTCSSYAQTTMKQVFSTSLHAFWQLLSPPLSSLKMVQETHMTH